MLSAMMTVSLQARVLLSIARTMLPTITRANARYKATMTRPHLVPQLIISSSVSYILKGLPLEIEQG